MKYIFALLSMIISISTQASLIKGSHIFVIVDENLNRKLSLVLPTDVSQAAHLYVSQPQDGPDLILLSSDIPNVEPTINPQSQVRNSAEGVNVNLGRSGMVSIKFVDNSTCIVQSSMREFYLPQSDTHASCSYYFTTGPRPGMSGSN